ncbi:hypothetical protein [Mycobacterium gordonae]|uniref:phage tail fiber protein n=1 Tax=Mycobacterium gordonae TaxID=1778 RepID=UPI0008494211|nr:hypothetical protein [Mycobacterium gordonae]ODR15923.1 hypothetical protein BHQ23_31780 [Mycobacterium gordonae]
MAVNSGLTLYSANALLNTFRNQSFAVSSVYVMLHTNPPGEFCEDNISVGDPSLKLVNFSAPTLGALVLSASPIWTNGGTSETLRYLSTWDGPTGPGTDEPLWVVALTTPQAWADADTYTLDSLGLVLAPILQDDGS